MSNNRNNRKSLVDFGNVAKPLEKPNPSTTNTPPADETTEKPATQGTDDKVETAVSTSTTEGESHLQIDDIVSSIVDTPKQPKKRQVNFYIDEDVIRELEKFNKKHGKGAKSNLVNEFLRKAFKL